MDALLLMHRCVGAYGYDGRGDYFMDPDGALHRRAARDVSPLCLHRRAASPSALVRWGAGGAVLAQPALRPGGEPRNGCSVSCMTANGSMSAPRRRSGRPTTGCSAGPALTTSTSDDGRAARACRASSRSRPGSRFWMRSPAEFWRSGRPARPTRATVLLPNRRACRALGDAMLRASPDAALLLPAILPIGDVGLDEEFGTDDVAAPAALDLPPAIPPLRRQLLLAEMIRAREGASGADEPARVAGLASELSRACSIRSRPRGWASTGSPSWCPRPCPRTGGPRSTSFASSPIAWPRRARRGGRHRPGRAARPADRGAHRVLAGRPTRRKG